MIIQVGQYSYWSTTRQAWVQPPRPIAQWSANNREAQVAAMQAEGPDPKPEAEATNALWLKLLDREVVR